MFVRMLALTAGLAGAAALSQFPEFSQQYRQRLGGAVDALGQVVSDIDADAAAIGLTHAAALDQLATGGAFGAARAASLRRTVARHAALSADLAALEDAGPFLRLRRVAHMSDREIAARAWAAYEPALPLTFEGLVLAGLGFVAGSCAIRITGRGAGHAMRRRRRRARRARAAPRVA